MMKVGHAAPEGFKVPADAEWLEEHYADHAMVGLWRGTDGTHYVAYFWAGEPTEVLFIIPQGS